MSAMTSLTILLLLFLVDGAPVSDENRVTSSPVPQLHIFDGYDPDDLQSVNYTRLRPWQINKDVCPPILCPNLVGMTSSPLPLPVELAGASAVPEPILMTAQRQPSVTATGSPASFPFLEADIVLDQGLDFVQPEVFQKQMQLRVRPPPHRSPQRPSQRPHSSTGSSRRPRSTPGSGTGAKVQRREKRALVKRPTRLWPDGIVPYSIDNNLANETKESINAAMNHFSNFTCIRFRRKTSNDTDYLFFIHQPGCWSSIGRIGGRQLISFGEGCEAFGTVVHEMTHALGVWHEQSRPDRDHYVRVLAENIEPDSLEQFAKRSENETTSLGYAYDYHSIMHYGNNYYSTSTAKTLVPIGIGRTMKFQIGQRKKLSDIDAAQLNNLYSCHAKEAARKACGSDEWTKFRSSCYKFESVEQKPFYEAAEVCRRNRAQLVAINSREEDNFVKSQLSRNYPDDNPMTSVWITGGLLTSSNSTLVWYMRGSHGNDVNATYVGQWTANRMLPVSADGRQSVITLRRVQMEGGAYVTIQFEWDTIELETNMAVANRIAYPFICEAKANITCFRSRNASAVRGEDYRGTLSSTMDGHTCQRWSKRYPHDHQLITGNRTVDARQGLGDHNNCRNPGGLRNRPWCYTLLKDVTWQYCDVPVCSSGNH